MVSAARMTLFRPSSVAKSRLNAGDSQKPLSEISNDFNYLINFALGESSMILFGYAALAALCAQSFLIGPTNRLR
jgi:hypothetical protein